MSALLLLLAAPPTARGPQATRAMPRHSRTCLFRWPPHRVTARPQDGHEVLVDECDVEAKARDQAAARVAGAAAQEARLADQLRVGGRLRAEAARSMGVSSGAAAE